MQDTPEINLGPLQSTLFAVLEDEPEGLRVYDLHQIVRDVNEIAREDPEWTNIAGWDQGGIRAALRRMEKRGLVARSVDKTVYPHEHIWFLADE